VGLFTTGRPSIAHVPPAPETDEDRYQKNLIALHAIEKEMADSWHAVSAHLEKFKDGRAGWLGGELYTRVNAMQYDPILQSLESKLAEVTRRRTLLYAEHSKLKIATGKTR
jgi:hypothetical protein